MSLRGKVFSYPESFRSLKILIAAKYGDHDLSLDPGFVFGQTNLSKEWLAKFPMGKVPGVELSDGQTLDESNSAAWLLCPDNMTGGGDKNTQSSILRWISLADLEVTPASCNWVYPKAGLMPASPDMERGRADLLRFLTWLNTELRLRTWLVGERITLADISLMSSLLLVFNNKALLDMGEELPHVTRWYNTVINQTNVKSVLNGVNLELKASTQIIKKGGAGE